MDTACPGKEYRLIRRLLNQRSKDCSSQESSIVWSLIRFQFHRIPILLPHSRGEEEESCFRGVVGPTVEQDRLLAIRPPPSQALTLTMGRAGVTWQPVPEIWGRHTTDIFFPDYSPAARWPLTCPTTFATLLPSLSPSLHTFKVFWLSAFLPLHLQIR